MWAVGARRFHLPLNIVILEAPMQAASVARRAACQHEGVLVEEATKSWSEGWHLGGNYNTFYNFNGINEHKASKRLQREENEFGVSGLLANRLLELKVLSLLLELLPSPRLIWLQQLHLKKTLDMSFLLCRKKNNVSLWVQRFVNLWHY